MGSFLVSSIKESILTVSICQTASLCVLIILFCPQTTVYKGFGDWK